MDKNFNFNQILLLIIGLWPYQKSKFAQIRYICIFIICTTGILFQFTAFLTSNCTADFIIKVLSSVFPMISVEIKYISFFVNNKAVKYLINYLQCIYANLKDHNEVIIIEKYGSKAKRYTIALTITALMIAQALIHLIVQMWPSFCNIIVSINGSQKRSLFMVTEYFINQEKYFYFLFLHMYIFYYVGIFIIIATGTSLYAYLQYACGMFKIASYRIESAMEIYTSQKIPKNENLLHKSIIYAIDIQRRAISFCECIQTTFEVTFIFLIAFGVLALSLNIFQVYQILSSGRDIEELLMPYFSSVSCILYMFFANVIGQEVTDHYNYMYDTTYKTQWYLAPLHIQKLVIFLLQRGNKSFGLSVCGLFVSSLECFATLVNTSISYFIVMYSVR
ncbi:odorant receptor 49a-like [Cardiocondyla obscurior]|uniref:odorant receptor 49a-like n=1 Tax=Cardiocondyla obscurior TaxID=286306 RepID=UPI0039656061